MFRQNRREIIKRIPVEYSEEMIMESNKSDAKVKQKG